MQIQFFFSGCIGRFIVFVDGLDFGLCAIRCSLRAPLVEDTAVSVVNLLYPIYIGASNFN